MSSESAHTREMKALLNKANKVWFGIERGTHTSSDLDEILDPKNWEDPDVTLDGILEPDENLYLVSRRHTDSNEVIFDTPVKMCSSCGVIYVAKEGVYGRPEWSCPLGHRQ